MWQIEGRTSSGDRAHKIVSEIINSSLQKLLPDGIFKEISKLMMSEARQYGISVLPTVR